MSYLGKGEQGIFYITVTTLTVTWSDELISSAIGNRFVFLRNSESMRLLPLSLFLLDYI